MYYLFRKHHWKPSDYMKMSYLQSMVVRGFIMQECEDIKAETEELEAEAESDAEAEAETDEDIKKSIIEICVNANMNKSDLSIIKNLLKKL